MTRKNLADILISARPRIWYLAVAGCETVSSAMENLHELQNKLNNGHLNGAIVDFRMLTGTTPDENWKAFIQGLEFSVPNGLPISWIATPQSQPAANILIAATHRSGAMSQLCLNWSAAAMGVGLASGFPDPLPKFLKQTDGAPAPAPAPASQNGPDTGDALFLD